MAICPDGHQSTASDYCDVCGLSIGGTVTVAAPVSSGGSASASSVAGGKLGEPCPNCLLPRTDDPFCEGCGYDFATATPVAPPPTVVSNIPPTTTPATQPAPSDPNSALAATAALDLDAELEAAIAAASQKPADPPVVADPPVEAPVTTARSMNQNATPTIKTQVGWTLVAVADRAYYDSVVAEGEIDPNAYPFPPYCPERRFAVSGDTVRIGRSSTVRGTVVEIDLTGPPTDPGVSHLHAVLQARPDGGWTLLDPGSANGTILNDDTAAIPENHPMPIDDGYRIHLGIWTTLTLVKE